MRLQDKIFTFNRVWLASRLGSHLPLDPLRSWPWWLSNKGLWPLGIFLSGYICAGCSRTRRNAPSGHRSDKTAVLVLFNNRAEFPVHVKILPASSYQRAEAGSYSLSTSRLEGRATTLQITTTALGHGLTLVTGNVRHFVGIGGLKINRILANSRTGG
jgi:hypothetical protein